jgi:hypothetical protein
MHLDGAGTRRSSNLAAMVIDLHQS